MEGLTPLSLANNDYFSTILLLLDLFSSRWCREETEEVENAHQQGVFRNRSVVRVRRRRRREQKSKRWRLERGAYFPYFLAGARLPLYISCCAVSSPPNGGGGGKSRESIQARGRSQSNARRDRKTRFQKYYGKVKQTMVTAFWYKINIHIEKLEEHCFRYKT